MKIEINIGPKTREVVLNEQLDVANNIRDFLKGKNLLVYDPAFGKEPKRDEYIVQPRDSVTPSKQRFDIEIQIPYSTSYHIPSLDRLIDELNLQQNLHAKLVR